MAKVYYFETEKKIYTVVGTSIKDVKDYIEENKRDFSFDMNGSYKVSIQKDARIQWYDTCDGEIDIVNITDSLRDDISPEFITWNARQSLLKQTDLEVK